MGNLTQKTASEIAALKTNQGEAINAANTIINSHKYTQTAELLDRANKTAETAAAVYAETLANRSTTPEQIASAKAAYNAASDVRTSLTQSLTEMTAQANNLLTGATSYQSSVDRTAATQTTSPAPTLAQDQAAATEAGKIAASQASPNPPPVLTSVPPVPPYVPALPNDVDPNFIPALPTPPASRGVITADNIAEIKATETVAPQFVPALPNDVDPNFISAPPTPPASRGVITADNIAEIKATETAAPQYVLPAGSVVASYPGAILNPDIVNDIAPEYAETVKSVNAFEDSLKTPSEPLIDQIGTNDYGDETYTADRTGSADAANIPEERKEIDSSDRYVATLDLTATDDPLGDKIAELQGGQNTGTSTLPTRNQQSGIGSPKDWRFRMSLAPSANYLYKAATPGILKPLMATNGVIFPYSPNIVVSYNANYNSADLVHTNYKIYNYKNSSIESVSVTGDFTCQDSAEANYVLAVIHFFKSVTKMFYGQDQNPTRGTPPPLVYLTGFGQYQFDMHPVVVTSFTHTFPADVDYVNAYPTNNSSSIGGQNMAPYMPQIATFFSPLDRLRTLASNIVPGGRAPPPTFINSKNINEVTRVPAKITIQLTCLPIITRNAMSNSFSLQKYASGELMRGSVNFNKTGGGIW